MRRLTALAVVLLGCSDERTLVLERLPLNGCAESLLPQVTQVLIGAEGDFPEQVISQPPDQPFSAAAFPQSSRVLTVTGIVAGQPTLVGRTGELDLVHEPASLPVAYGPAGGTCATTPMHHARSHAAAV